ncbi:MAG: redoxin domain-containing protein [Bacteroidales bacterium]|nr:redoxin domain-containing protein [Bacteroidales bacterium]
MKRIIPGIIIILLLLSCSRNDIRIKGKISDCSSDKIFFDEVDVYLTRAIDSLKLKKNGSFRFSDDSRFPKFYQLRLVNGEAIQLLLEPGEKAEIRADCNDLQNTLEIKGSEGSVLVNEIVTTLSKAIEKLDSIRNLYENTTDSGLRGNLVKEYGRVMDDHREYTIGFLLEHSTSLASFMALYQQYDKEFFVLNKLKDLQFYKIITDSLGKKYPRVKQVIALRQNTQKLLSQYYNQKLLSLADGESIGLPEIALPDTRGDIISLKSLKGKYVLLSFWATWDDRSISYNLGLKDIYRKYRKKGFEIYHVSLDRSIETWNRSIIFDELEWINVIDTTYPYSEAAGVYNVQALPANYLIDKDFSSIIAKNLLPAQIDDRLNKLFN